ncbi:glycosyltransferase family 25 protein [Paracoccus denitrificans]|jgi:glycosyl transferase family 25|uniref:Glycosyl transferase, family 25 n=1 Tax=Paracoccus denitrificans (strain Pd 1222) TaxID=318586 RepID=A1B5P7_PARDP|nr:glycosyltransferase family 25 protein [Paracoccus denitrificans]ABL70841.1 glycosyl transferase, family 25 [Paracoccus denitrificans PD1222]MBB4627641.1 glycosyl transferase family 25 [Paracoccus denitrificans]MCU7429007.1 glycosyltransferase family 25 protein [Paracoccus denitrificans]QAR26162.1 glycosyltransferase family 25 protein [Paracoccus denitrificans]UPV95077.1 glycosyltransferase family 25 protein [Paracoccus denitrificans]
MSALDPPDRLVPVYLINLDGSDERLRSATRQLDEAGIPFERVPAFDGRALRIEEFPDYDPAGAMAYMGRPLRGGEIGCYLSHLDCARRFLDSGAEYGVVFEDDMQLKPGFAKGLRILSDWLDRHDRDWDLINIGAGQHKIFTPVMGFEVAGRHHDLTRAHYFPMTTTGLIWSRQGAETFVSTHRRITAGVDNHFRHWLTRSDRGLAVWPPLVTTTGVESQIEDGKGKRSASGRHPLYGLIKQRRQLINKLIAWRHKRRLARG